jgi:hypothetical protein
MARGPHDDEIEQGTQGADHAKRRRDEFLRARQQSESLPADEGAQEGDKLNSDSESKEQNPGGRREGSRSSVCFSYSKSANTRTWPTP